MAYVTREQILEALFSLVSLSSPAFITKSRRLRLWGDVDPADRPALFQFERAGDLYEGAIRGTPPKRTYQVEIFIYTDARGVDVPASILNPLIDAIDIALMPDNKLTGKQTLGGLVEHVYIDGRIIKEPGDLDNDGLALIPVKILVP